MVAAIANSGSKIPSEAMNWHSLIYFFLKALSFSAHSVIFCLFFHHSELLDSFLFIVLVSFAYMLFDA